MAQPEGDTRQPRRQAIDYDRALHVASWVLLVACPIVIALPPRKLDLYTVGLAGMTAYSANHLVQERKRQRGRQYGQVNDNIGMMKPAEEKSDLDGLRQEMRKRREEALSVSNGTGGVIASGASRPNPDWVAQRDAEVKDAIDEGKGLSDMIMDQIWDVWNWGKKKEDEDG